MAQVSLRINGYSYLLGCADGEESHLLSLAEGLDQRIEDIKTTAGPSGEARLLLMAALVLADELHDLRKQMEPPDGDKGPADTKPAEKPDQKAARRLGRLARRAESIATGQDSTPPSAEDSPTVKVPVTDAVTVQPAADTLKAPDGGTAETAAANAEIIAAPPEHL